jgi:pimeloyl-ACP methyl ester carboxylesterase
VLASARALPARVVAGAVLGGVAPTQGPDAAPGGLVRLASHFEPVFARLHEPIGVALTALVWSLRPLISPTFNLIMRLSPKSDQAVFARPEMKAMFLDDLLHGSRWGLRAPVYDLVLFGRPWGFRLRDIRVPIRFWHGDADHLVPLAHGQHQARLIPDATLRVRRGESHLGSLAAAEEILDAILGLWPSQPSRRATLRPARRAS